MRGKILEFDNNTGTGKISGDDGVRYAFSATDWKSPLAPLSGQTIDFDADGANATSIYRLAGSGTVAGEKNKVVAALLAFFLGAFGAHKFYLGKNTAGIIMLLSCLIGWILLFIPPLIMSVIAFIEFIIYLVSSDEDFERNYVQGDKQWF
jgi:TM2 domain-containing membrane protein YozV